MLSPLSARLDWGTEGFRLAINDCPSEMVALHTRIMGQFVPTCKDNLSRDSGPIVLHSVVMADWLDEGAFNHALCARVKTLRGGRTQSAMANALGVPLERYKKYETRSPLPAYLIPRLAEVADRSINFIVTGKEGAMPQARRATINEETLAKLLYSLGPALPSDGMTERAARALTVALQRALELLPDDPSKQPSDDEFARAARAAMIQFREASQP